MCSFNGIRRGNNFGGEPIGRFEADMRARKLKNGNASAKDEVTGRMIKVGGDRVVDWIWRLGKMVFERGVVPENWRFAVTVLLYEGK